MIIGINLLFLIPGKVGGTETSTRGLLDALRKIDKSNTYIIFCNKENYQTFNFRSGNFRKVVCPIKASFRPLRILYEQLILPFQVWLHKVEVLLSLGYTSPVFLPSKSMVITHDLNWYFNPEDFSLFERYVLKTLVTFSAKRADLVFTPSVYSKKDLCKILRLSPKKVVAAHWGIDKKRFRPIRSKKEISKIKGKYGIRGKYILTTSAAYKFKNLARLIDAFNLVLKEKHFSELQLLVVGLGGRGKPEILKKIRENNLTEKVIIAGWVENEEVPILYSAAELYIHPSLYEGFGFPVLEAMACRCPVVSSRSASLPELVGNAGIIVNARDPESIAEAAERVLKNSSLASRLIKKGFQRSQGFTWKKTAEIYLHNINENTNSIYRF